MWHPFSLFFFLSLLLMASFSPFSWGQVKASTAAQAGLRKAAQAKVRSHNKDKRLGSGLGAAAAEGRAVTPLVKSIQVAGLKRIDVQTVKARISQAENSPLEGKKVRDDILSIMRLGYFTHVQVDLNSDGTLVYRVFEKPALVEIVFEGFSEVKEDDLKQASGMKPFEILDPSRVQTAAEKIQKFYEGKGYFLAQVNPRIEATANGDAAKVIFEIVEGEKVQIQEIKFLGNKDLSSDFLRSKLSTSEAGFFSFVSGSGSYKQEGVDRDLQIVKLIYMNEGYIQAKIERPHVYISPDKRYISITYRIEEGARYRVGEVDFSGDILFSFDELRQVVEMKDQEYFSYEVLQKDLMSLQAKYGDLGYAYVNVIPRTRINEKDRIVDLTFEMDKGPKVYFGRFTITGNTKTRDKVIRRELRIYEGELYNETARKRSFENVQRLGFFEDVQFKTSSDPEAPDVMNVEIAVKERNTGSINLGAGYGTVTGFTMQGSLNQINFLGKGQRLSASLNSSRIGSFYNVNFTEPNFDDTDYLLGFDLYQSAVDRFEYRDQRTGGAVRVGKRFSDYFNASLRYRLDDVKLTAYYDSNNNILTDLTIFPVDTATGILSSLTGSLEYDERDDRFMPSKGRYALASLEYAGVGGDLRFLKTNLSLRYFKKVIWDVVWRSNLTHGYLSSLDPERDPPFNERFLLGGPYSLRGYRFFRVGQPRFSSQLFTKYTSAPYYYSTELATRLATVPFGGLQQLLLQTELEFPMVKEAGIRGVVFFDVGQAEDQLDWNGFYSNWGLGFRWFSPIGPLRFEWGFPLRKNPASPDKVVFEFSIGSPF
jgi:outer membrane protein insertion porin family